MRFTIVSSTLKMLLATVTMLALSVAPATAQDAAGKFTLAKEVRWGGAVLPAGDYNYTLERQTGQLLFLRNANGQPGAIVLVKSASSVNDRGHDRLVLQRSGEDWFVSSMFISSLGQELSFGAPRVRNEVAKNAPTPAKVAALSTP